MVCKKCGKYFSEGQFCPYCGSAQYDSVNREQDESSLGFAVLCFFIPILGLILYIVWKDELPLRAKSCGKGGLAGLIVGILLYIFLILFLVWFVQATYTFAFVPLTMLI